MKRILYSLVSTIVLYLLIAFVNWDLLIILRLGEIDPFFRFFIILFFIPKEMFTQLIYEEFEKK
jgi:hypothetical protein